MTGSAGPRMHEPSICIVNNIPTPYRRELFYAISRRAEDLGIDFSVLYLAKSEAVRDWIVELRSFETVLPVLWQRRNSYTPTSDFIVNTKFVVRTLRPQHVILFGYNYVTYLIIAFLRAVFRRPTHLFCETTMSDTGAAAWKRILKSLLFRLVFDRYIVPGKRSAEYLAAHGVRPENISFACNSSPMVPKRPPKLIPTKQLKLLFVGRLSPEKRILEFTRVFAELGLGHHLTVVGDGDIATEISKVAKCHTCIDILGPKEPAQMSEIYGHHDVLVLVSNSEPWGMVVNEAINHGLALVLSPQVGCMPDLLDGNGVVIEDISPDQLAACLDDIARNLVAYRAKSLEIAKKTTTGRQASGFLAILTEDDHGKN